MDNETKSIQAVQAAISYIGDEEVFFDNNRQELEKEKELEKLKQDLENAKLELEAKDAAYKHAFSELEHHRKTADELSNLLRKCDSKKLFYANECRVSNAHMNELEFALKQAAHQAKESEKVQEQLSHVVSELVSAQGHILNMEAEVAIMQEARAKAVLQAEATESVLSEEKQKSEVLTRRVSEMTAIIIDMKKRILEMEREKANAVAEKVAESELAAKAIAEVEKKSESIRSLEDQLLEKTAIVCSLQVELNRTNDLHASAQKAVSDTAAKLRKLEENLETQQKKNSDQANRIRLLEGELKQLRAELGNAHTEINRLKEHLKNMKSELETEQVEIAVLKFELHKGKSKLAAAEARVTGEVHSNCKKTKNTGETNSENEGTYSRNEFGEETVDGGAEELENMKKDLELAAAKIGQLRTRAAQAISRAEAAEKAKAEMEDQMKKSKVHPTGDDSIRGSHSSAATARSSLQPLAEVLDMKF
ncbi:uncharacterized protein LOC127240174 [Andrographis paniculata]|uniref:uncharacterized protein LOC127240174 n=1 Tax=Andrographis paniculata TaxID=175694 RepID=UPI0021E7134D|nr:uncharacterized protein LOC127240174 [Andrographis paniculata]